MLLAVVPSKMAHSDLVLLNYTALTKIYELTVLNHSLTAVLFIQTDIQRRFVWVVYSIIQNCTEYKNI
jgi:hypothetical protein